MTIPLLLAVNNLTVMFDSQIVLSNISFSVAEGEILTIIGPNGAGKSTLIRAVLGLITTQSGDVQLKANIRIGYMPQKLTLRCFMPITVAKFLSLNKTTDIAVLLKQVVLDLAITDLMQKPLQQISGGELQRVLLARALLQKPELLVLDEPTQGVDVNGQIEFYQLLNKVKASYNCGILMVSHDLHLVMANTNAVLCLNKHICCFGHPELVSSHPEFVNMFGAKIARELAIYMHSHDHKHCLDGKIIHD